MEAYGPPPLRVDALEPVFGALKIALGAQKMTFDALKMAFNQFHNLMAHLFASSHLYMR